MKIYTEVMIESAEQAEALPIGTMAVHWRSRRIAEKVRTVQWDSFDESCGNRAMVRWTALVPTEVEAFQSEPLRTTHLVEWITGPGPFTVYVTQGDDS